MKKNFKIVVLLLSFIFVLNFTGCTIFTQPGGHFFNLGFSTHMPFDGTFENRGEKFPLLSNGEKAIISSTSEFDELITQSPYIKDYGWSNKGFISTTSKFNEEFFKYNQIVCFIVVSPDTSYSFNLLKTNYNSGILTITLRKSSTGMGLHVIGYLLAIVEIEKVPTDTVIEIVYKSNWWR